MKDVNLLIEKNDIQEMNCGENFAYILNDNTMFLPTDYKVLQSQMSGGFLKCMKILYNGKIELFYMTKNMKSLTSILSNIDSENFMTIIANLLTSIMKVKSNGFLSCQNLDVSFDKIFVDLSTFRVSLVYVPVSKRIYEDYMAFENDIRTRIVKIIVSTPTLVSPRTLQFSNDLSNGILKLEDLYNRIKGVGVVPVFSGTVSTFGLDPRGASGQIVQLISLDPEDYIEINVNKDEFIIGKNRSRADVVIPFNHMISRVHCRIDKRDQQVLITDLKSTNGTFVNRIRLQPNQPHLLSNGDVVRLANSDFQVRIR